MPSATYLHARHMPARCCPVLLLACLLVSAACAAPTAVPAAATSTLPAAVSAQATAQPTATPTATATLTPTRTAAPPTFTATPSPTATAEPTFTPTPTAEAPTAPAIPGASFKDGTYFVNGKEVAHFTTMQIGTEPVTAGQTPEFRPGGVVVVTDAKLMERLITENNPRAEVDKGNFKIPLPFEPTAGMQMWVVDRSNAQYTRF